jgi:CTP:molybdopterin cytidylyltransferase MocA
MREGNDIFSVILLAGDRISDDLAKASPCNRKALLDLNGQPMLLYVLNTLMASAKVGSVFVVGNRVREISSYPSINTWLSFENRQDHVRFIEGENSPATSVVAALKALCLQSPILVTTADNPLLTIETLNQFCDMALNLNGADVAVGLAVEEDIRVAFPGARRTFVRLGGSGYSGCNLFTLMSNDASRAAKIWCDVEKRRKRPWQLISYFGVGTLFKALIGRLDLEEAFRAVSHFMHLNVKEIILRDPTAAMDVDRLEHVSIARDVLSERRSATVLTRS